MSDHSTALAGTLSWSNGHPKWYRSLYWRIALGLFAFMALMLTAQGALFIWMIDQTAGSMPARSPRRLAVLVASDIGTALSSNASLDLREYVEEQFRDVFRPFVVVMRDGSVHSNHTDIPEELRDAVEFESARGFGRPPDRGQGRRGPPSGIGAVPPEPQWESAPIFVNREIVGRVAVLARFPSDRMLRELGPTMAAVGIAVLGIGMTLIALVVFGPARRRLQAVRHAAEQLGAGDAAARAPEHGGDEVASVARAFNRMAAELESRARELEASDRARRQLLADVSHELMTPLTAMRGYVETLSMKELPLDQDTRDRYLRIIDDETHRLERIVGDLLDLAKLETGGAPFRSDTVRVRDLFNRAAERHERAAAARHVSLQTRVDSSAELVHGDTDRLEQVLQNLVANALRHTPDGGEISLSSKPDGDHVILTVRDNGSGIPEEHLPLIFDRFYKADASRQAAGGSGLGLSIVKTIVERHGGTISARNDHGAVFDIRLPR
jgi:signal transduction histidine kinase